MSGTHAFFGCGGMHLARERVPVSSHALRVLSRPLGFTLLGRKANEGCIGEPSAVFIEAYTMDFEVLGRND
jgi:hypothetical protein